jgi:uncharacterized protein with NRDE domain
MSILFIIVGDATNPTIIGNNRDEYLNRPTERGQYFESVDQYYPVDIEGCGSWLAFDQLSTNHLRFAIVLNLDVRCNDPQKGGLSADPSSSEKCFSSRDLLVKQFIENNSMDSASFSQMVHDSALQYRPFNLIVGDHTGTYYTSSYDITIPPTKLTTGEIYGISNGDHLLHAWSKTTLGKALLAERKIVQQINQSLLQQQKVLLGSNSSHNSSNNSMDSEQHNSKDVPTMEKRNTSTCIDNKMFGDYGDDDDADNNDTAEILSEWCSHLFRVLETDTPQADAKLGNKNTAPTHFAAIFAHPVTIPLAAASATEEIDPVVSCTATTPTTTQQVSSLGDAPSAAAKFIGGSSYMHSTHPHLPYVARDTFGTRTSTVLVHIPLPLIHSSQPQEQQSPLHPPYLVSQRNVRNSLFMIQEKVVQLDCDTGLGHSSISTQTNLSVRSPVNLKVRVKEATSSSSSHGRMMVFDNLDVLSVIATMLGQGCAFPFALTSKHCYIGTKGAGMKLTSNPRHFCTSISLVCFAVSCGYQINLKLLNCVVMDGHLDVLQWLRSQTPPCSWDERTSEAAAQGGHLEILQWLRSQTPPCPWSERTTSDAAAQGGHLEILQWLRSQTSPCSWDERTSEAAAQGGHLEILQWLRSQTPPCSWDERTSEAAAQGGHLEILQWLRSQTPPCAWDERTSEAAAQGGHLEILQWLRSHTPPCAWDEYTCYAAAQGGHLEILQWLRSQTPPCSWDEDTCTAVAGGGHLEILQWLRSQTPPCPWSESTCHAAAQGGFFEILQWLRSETPPCSWNERSCYAAARGGHLEILQWLRFQTPPCPLSASTCEAAAQGGHLEILQWLRSQTPPCAWSENSCCAAAEGGHLEILQWLRSQTPPCPWSKNTCSAAARGGHLEILQWLRSQTPPCPWNLVDLQSDAHSYNNATLLSWLRDRGLL